MLCHQVTVIQEWRLIFDIPIGSIYDNPVIRAQRAASINTATNRSEKLGATSEAALGTGQADTRIERWFVPETSNPSLFSFSFLLFGALPELMSSAGPLLAPVFPALAAQLPRV
jgi:hypothetical protein